MDVRMPDGTVVENVPDNITQTELLSRYQKYQSTSLAQPSIEGSPIGAEKTSFSPVSRNLMAQGENLRNKQPFTPVVAPVVAQPTTEPTEEELAIASQPYRGAILKRRPATVTPPVEATVEAPPTESELAVAQKPATVNPILARQGKAMRGEQVQAPIVSPIPEGQSVARQVADVPLQTAKGAVSGIRTIADFFGADSDASNNLRGAEDYLGKLMSAQSQNDSKEIARIKQEVQDKGLEDQIGGAIRALRVAPIDTLVNALGTSAPALVAGLGAAFFGAPAAVATGVGAGIGAMMGAGTIKGTIYEETKQALIGAGVDPATAEKTAQEAQKYNGKNLDQILLGGLFGLAASGTGMESALIKGMANKILAKSATVDSAKKLAKDFVEQNYTTVAKELTKSGLVEGTPEFLQAFQEATASNIAQQREGLDVPTFRGAVFAGVLEFMAGTGLGVATKGVELGKEASLSPSQRIGKALQQDISEKGYTQENARREALARLNPDQAQYSSTAAPAQRPQPPAVKPIPAKPAAEQPSISQPPQTIAASEKPAKPPMEEPREVPSGLLRPGDFETPTFEEPEDVSVTPVTVTAPGAPITLYRGVPKGRESQETVGGALFMTPDRSVAETYAGKQGAVAKETITFNNMLNAPTWVAAKERLGLPQSASMADLVNAARNAGHDGVTFVTQNGPEYIYIPVVGAAVTPVTLKEESALPEFPTQEDNLKYYFANNKNVKQEDIVTFDDATFFKQPDGSYADVPDASKKDADVTYSSIDEIKDVIKDNFSGTTFNDFLLRPESFSELSGGKQPPKEKRSVTGFVERGKAAMDSFESAVTEQFGLTVEQARTALGKLIAEKIVKINPLTGSFELKDGRFWDKEVMLRAAGVKPEEVAEVVEKKTGPDEESGPFVQHKIEDFPTFYPLVAQLKMSEDVPQFKYGANEKGVVEPLGGTFDTSGVAPIQVWVRKNGDLEVISGRHRLDLAKRSGRVTIPAQYHYESQGFDKERAAILDAEFNIRDNQGKVKDYVNYFKGAKLSREEADSRGLLAKDLGKRGYTIANEGSEELIAAHRGDAVGDEAAFLIAKNAPQDGRLQSVGIKAIQDGKSMSTAINTMQAVKALAGESQTSVDMFGFDDSAMKEADEMASIAARKQREISQRLSAITGAAKNPALAKAEGIDIKDPAAVKKRIEELRQLKASWDNWSTNPDLVGEIRQERGPKPLTLTSETEAEIKEREKKEKADKAASEKTAKDAEAKEKADREKKAIADASKKADFTLTPSEEVSKAEQAEIDRKKAEQELSGQGGMFDEKTKEPYTKEQREDALAHAKETGGEVVWQKGEHALIRGYSVLSGDPVYMPTMGGSRGRVDISSYTGKQIPDDIKAEMIKEKERLENEAAKKHEKKSFITFNDGVALSKDIPSKIAGVIREWKNLLNLEPNVYVSTIDDAQENKFNFTGPHRRIGSGTLDANERGSMRRMSDGSYYILFTKSTSITKMLEVIAHEMGHLHQKQFFDNATAKEKEALQAAHRNWLEKQKGKTAQELVTALRARTTGKTTPVPEGKMADSLGAYWKSFGEWYADQTARWAVSSEKPVSIVEFYFRRLGIALRKFYQSLKAQKYLPDETFKQYIEAATRRPANLAPSGDEASLMQQGFDFEEESNSTDKIAAENPVESKALNEMDQLPTAKKKLPPGRSPELAAAAQMVKDGTMTSAQFDSLANKYKPIYIFTEPLVPATIEKMVDALTSTQSKQVNPKILNGTAVGLRLDIPAFNRKGVYVVSIHEKGTKAGSGKIIGYGSAAKAINVKFGLGNQNAALNIAAGEAKKPLQTIEGSYVSATPEQIYEQAKSALIDPAWTQIGINPTRHSYFYDRRTTVPVVAADEVLQIGNMVLGKNVTFGKKEDFLFNIDSQPAMSAGELEQRNADIRREQISEYAGIRRQMMSAIGKVAAGEVSTDLQKRLTSLIGKGKDLKAAIDSTKQVSASPEKFLAKALSEYDAGNISADVLAVIQTSYNKYPQLLDGMRLSVKATGKGESGAAGRFIPMSRLVRLFKSTSGVNDPVTIRHEITHSLEQMMSGVQRQIVFDAWIKDLQNAVDKNKDEAHQKFFHAVIDFIENPTEVSHRKTVALLPSYEMYQYVNPSEYWAVNAEKLMAKQLGTAWQRFKLFVQRMFEGLKSVFGFNNKYAVHKVFNQIMSGEMKRISHGQLVDMVTGDKDFIALNNRQDDMDLLEKYNRPQTPMMRTSSLKKNILSAASKTKAVFKQGIEDPKSLGIDTINLVDRGTIYLRNKNVWFGSGLDAANFVKYKGQMRDTNDIVNSSIALDNAIRSGVISTQVIMQGGIKYDPNTMNYVAQKRSKGMAGVYKAESVIKKRLGDQLGTDIIQGYLEAKRSLSIRNELDARQDQVDQLKDDLLNLQSAPGVDPADIDALKAELAEARKSLTSIQLVERKVSMSNEEIQEFLDREAAHPELRDIMKNWNAVNQNMLNFWFDVGLLSEARYELLSNIEDYIPWYRIMEDGSVSSETTEVKSKLQSTTRSMTNIGKEKIFKAGKPSVTTEFVAKNGQQTFKIQPSTVVSVEINGNPVNPNDVTTSPNGEVLINVPIAEGDIVEFKTNREIQNMIDNMTRNVMRMTMNGLRQYAANRIVADYATRNQKGQIRVFPKVDKENGRFSYVSNGRNIVVEIKDPLIAEAIFGLENLNIEMFKGLTAITNFVRRSITLSGAFQIKQVFKDAPTAAWVTGVKRPDLLIGGVYKGFVTSLLRPLANKLGKKITGRDYDIEPVIEILQAAGIGGFHSPSRTPETEIKMQIGLMNRNVFSFVLKGLDHIGDSSDMSQRVATYKRVLAETGDEAQALYQAANVINFLHHGSAQHAQAIVKLVPFMSAWANSLDVLAQSLAGGGLKGKSRAAALKQIAITGAALATSTLLYCMLVGGDDEYEKLDDQTKLRGYMIPGTEIMLPMNTSAGFLFKVLPELLYNKFVRDSTETPQDATRLYKALRDAATDMILGPEPVPAAIKPIVEIGLDKDFFTGKSVVPAGLEKVDAAEQYTATTSELGKMLSSLTGTDKTRLLNPIQADHIIKGLFGSAGALAMWASNLIGEAAETRPEMTLKQTPFIGAFLRPDVPRGPEDLFYDLADRVESAYATAKNLEGKEKYDELDKYIEKNEGLLGLYDSINEAKQTLGEINNQIRYYGTTVDKTITPKERSEEIKDLKEMKNEMLDGIGSLRKDAGL